MKIRDLYTKLMAMLSAGVLFASATPAAGHAEMGSEDSKAEIAIEEYITLEEDIKDNILTLDGFNEGVEHAYKYLNQFINYDKNDLKCLYYLVNREYMTDEDANELENNVVHGTDIANGEFQNFVDSYKLIDVIREYNQSVIKKLKNIIWLNRVNFNEYDKELLNKFLAKVVKDKKYNILMAFIDYNDKIGYDDPSKNIELEEMCLETDPELVKYISKVVNEGYDLETAITEYNTALWNDVMSKLIDESELCFDNIDKEIVHSIHESWAMSYKAVTNGSLLIEDEDYIEAFKALTTLNAEERKSNAEALSAGAKFLVENISGVSLINTQFDYLRENKSRKELDQYFDKEQLNAQQFVVRSDISLNINTPETETEVIALQFGQLKKFAVEFVNNDLITLFADKCAKKIK